MINKLYNKIYYESWNIYINIKYIQKIKSNVVLFRQKTT